MGLLGDYLPDWLPEDQAKREAAKMGLLNFGASMLANANQGFAPAFGHSLSGGVHAYQAGIKDSIEMQQKQQQANWIRQATSEMRGGGGLLSESSISQATLGQGAKNGSVGPTVENAALFDQMKQAAPRKQSGLSLSTLQQGALLGMKGIEPLFNMYKYQNDGAERKPGTWYEDPMTGEMRYIQDPTKGYNYDPATNSVKPIAGFNENLAALEGAKTGAQEAEKAKFQLLPLGYVDQGGRPIGGTVGQYIGSFSQPAPQVQRPPHGAGRDGLDVTKLSPQQQAFLIRQDPSAFANGVERFAGGPPALQSEAEKQLQLGAITGRQSTQQDLNKNWIAASYNPVVEAGRAASTMTASLDALKTFDLQTGWGTEAKAHAANVLAGLGIAPEGAKLFAANAQKFQTVAMDRLLTVLQAQKGPQTEGDSTRAQQTFAQLKNTPAANQFIADLARAKANQDARRSQFYQEALPLAQQAGDLNEVDRRWSKIQGSIWNDPVLQPYMRGK